MGEIKKEKNIFESLQQVRTIMASTNIKKSGHNGFQNFDYYELKDFVPTATKLFNESGMCPMFNIVLDSSGIEVARLDIVKGTERVTFQVPTAEPSGNNAIQNLGSKITYLRRYLYLIALDLTENDTVDASDNSKDVKVVTKATKKQVELIAQCYDTENIEKIKEYYKVEKLEDLTVKQASECLAKKGK